MWIERDSVSVSWHKATNLSKVKFMALPNSKLRRSCDIPSALSYGVQFGIFAPVQLGNEHLEFGKAGEFLLSVL
jgi:hypothetical protein